MRLAMAKITMNTRHPKETVKKMRPYMTLTHHGEHHTQHIKTQNKLKTQQPNTLHKSTDAPASAALETMSYTSLWWLS
jgi:hypothetical protein